MHCSFFGCNEFPAEKTKKARSTIDDLVEEGAHSDTAGIRGEDGVGKLKVVLDTRYFLGVMKASS